MPHDTGGRPPNPDWPNWINLHDLAATITNPPANWQTQAQCRGQTRMFYPDGTTARAEHQANAARRVCAVCPARTPCLAQALTTPIASDHGIWGGTVATERRRLRTALRQHRQQATT